jgi:hypothetical protein
MNSFEKIKVFESFFFIFKINSSFEKYIRLRLLIIIFFTFEIYFKAQYQIFFTKIR